MAIFGSKTLGTIFNAQSNATTTQANAANNYGALYNPTGIAGTGYVTVASTAASQGYYHLASGTYQTQPAVYIPSPAGQIVSMTFVDATGLQYQLLVDSAYATLIQQISAQHQYRTGAPSSGVAMPAQKMLEGDFSPEEMEKAAQVIEEMGGDLAELH